MPKLAGKLCALVAMTASVFNAWCAVSCSLQAITSRHSCCQHERVPKPNQKDAPCPHPTLLTNAARMEDNAPSHSIAGTTPVLLGFVTFPTPLLTDRLALPLALGFPGVAASPSVSVLRI